MNKRCPRCKRTLPSGAFYKNRSALDGLNTYCKECRRLYESQPEQRAKRWAYLNTPEQAAIREARNASPDYQETRARYRAKPEVQRRKRERALLRKYGMSIPVFTRLLESQRGRCLICGEPLFVGGPRQPRTATVDHDHRTGEIRGILCHQCNVGLGDFRDSPLLLCRAARYLEKDAV